MKHRYFKKAVNWKKIILAISLVNTAIKNQKWLKNSQTCESASIFSKTKCL